ncbi:hypothetical protein SAMN05444392_10233 [Seinonella peptonophila]|uniref:Uncharacterized protein n=1 Tax=Seinonella peptonophila TaxID=112248 RepID=A0A1M4UUB5_9BACL|nr:hypothetical protein [Seinonella peptonophila]SHE60351.1 hypothetical protein SAMN05444392_10233 [Seinonella peptonophila]
MSRKYYQQLAERVNQRIGRRALTAEKIESIINRARRIRARHGVRALWNYASGLPYELFTEREINLLRQSPEWHAVSYELIDVLIQKGVITPWEAQFMKQYI